MQFHSPIFGLFLLTFVVMFHALRRNPDHVRWLVITASFVFYASWSLAYVPVLLASTLTTFIVARAIATANDEARKRRLVAIGVGFCVGLLVLFKYANFVLANIYTVMHWAGWNGGEVYLDLFFPVGISFYTFVNVAYLVDVYRGQVAAKQRLAEYVAPSTFFPHLLSGPIVRMSELLPQFDRLEGIKADRYKLALLLIFVGVAKKALAGLLDPIASSVFAANASPSALEMWTGVLAYNGQIYVDFSAYTDIAIGAALLVGIELPQNFNSPFIATSPIDFWRRWHMSLSSWIHDYGFLPLFRRFGNAYIALLVTWIFVGLWHGAQWMFVVYGLYHGIAIIVTRWIGLHVPDSIHERANAWWLLTLRRVLTIMVVATGLVLFRSTDFGQAARLAGSLFGSSHASTFDYEATLTLTLVGLALVIPHLIDAAVLHRRDVMLRGPWVWALAVFALAFAILFGTGSAGYIYFGF